MALCPWKIRLFSRQPIYSRGLDITNYGKTLYKQIHAPKHPETLGRKTLSGFNQLSSHLSIFWSKHCIKLPASITVSLEVVFCKLNTKLTKGFQWTALGFVCPHWISSFNLKIFKLELEISEFRSTSVGQSWAVRLLRRAPCREAGSATWHPSLSIRWLEQQSAHRDRCCWSRHLRDRDYEIHKLEGFSCLIFPSQCARAQHFVLDGYKMVAPWFGN